MKGKIMKQSNRTTWKFPNRAVAALITVLLASSAFLAGQQTGGSAQSDETKKKGTVPTKSPKKKKGEENIPPPQRVRTPLTKAEVEELWKKGNADLAQNEIRVRALAFEPEEDWIESLKKLPPLMPSVLADL